MSMQYPVLDNRPINRWKVVELKEELKRRKLMTKGLKEDLIKRLDEAIRNEGEAFESEVGECAQSRPNYVEMADDACNFGLIKTSEVGDVVGRVDIDDLSAEMDRGKLQEEASGGTDFVVVVEESAVLETSVGTMNETLKSSQKDADVVGEPEVLEASLESNSIFNEFVVTQIASSNKSQETFDNNKIKMETEHLKSPQMDAALVGESAALEASMASSHTVDDVVVTKTASGEKAPDRDEAKVENEGFQVKSESISTGNVSYYEKKELTDNLNADNVHLELEVGKVEMVQPSSCKVDDAVNHSVIKTSKFDDVAAGVYIDVGPAEMDRGTLWEEATGGVDSIVMVEESAALETSVGISSTMNAVLVTQVASMEEALENKKSEMENEFLKSPQKDAALVRGPEVLGSEDLKSTQMNAILVGESAGLEASMETAHTFSDVVVKKTALNEKALENNEINLENEVSKPLQMDAECDSSDPGNQVHEVISRNLGFQVKSDSISIDTVSYYEKKELKDNLNADNVHLELEVCKQEMVQPSSCKGRPNYGSMRPLDDQMSHKNLGFFKDIVDNKSAHTDFGKKNEYADVGSSAISKLDHYLIDDYVAEEVLGNKPIELSHNSKKVWDNNELNEVYIAKIGNLDGGVGSDLPYDKMETSAEERSSFAASAEERDDNRCTDMDFSKSSDRADGKLFEKVNLDQSSPDDSIEEDLLETKHVDSDHYSDRVGEKTDLTEVPGVKVSGSVDAVQHGFSSNELDSYPEEEDKLTAFSEKRKSQDEAAVVNKELPKRQRRWNSESLSIPERQGYSVSISTTPKDLFQTTVVKHITRSDSTGGENAPNERVVPPSSKSPTNSLRIDRFLRPFTLKAVQELLAKTGSVCSFWMDQIKTHCYVMYSSVQEAIETRNAVYNLQWPPNGGRLLVAEFVDPKEVKLRAGAPSLSAAAPVTTIPTDPSTQASIQPTPSAHQHSLRPHVPPQPPLSQLRPTSNPPTTGERLHLPPSRPLPVKVKPPIVTLDDLFRKTRATPRIYYLPLTEEQVAAKLAVQRKGKQ